MKKLNLEDIQVESYETQAELTARGTVKGNDDTQECGSPTEGTGCPSCFITECNTACGYSCYTDYPLCCGVAA